MLEELKEESIVNKVGGRFKLSTLIQKRLVQLNQGSRPLVKASTNDKMKIVLQEILEDKIFLDTSNEVRVAAGLSLGTEGPQFGMDDD
jgi:DNA-directed RNA polymerase subunit omega